MQRFLERLKLEREDVRQDLIGLNLGNFPIGRIGDFGCGWGFATLSLILELNAAESIGIDQFVQDDFLDVPSFEGARSQFDQLRVSVTTLPQDNATRMDILHLLDSGRFPTFLIGDIVTGANLPSNLDLAFCKHTLYNIFAGGYATNDLKGEIGVVSAIENIASAIKAGGLVCAVEPANSEVDFKLLFEQAGFSFVRMCRVHRGAVSWSGRKRTLINQDLIYCLNQ